MRSLREIGEGLAARTSGEIRDSKKHERHVFVRGSSFSDAWSMSGRLKPGERRVADRYILHGINSVVSFLNNQVLGRGAWGKVLPLEI